MQNLIRKNLTVGPLQCNCVILACEETREAIVIDPGDEPSKIIQALEKDQLKVKYLLHTHAHFDHIGGTKGVKEKVQGTICLHKDDEMIYNMLPMQGQMFGMRMDSPHPVEHFLEDEERIQFGKHSLQVIHTPGHSPGGVCFKMEGNESWLFSGDSLFEQSIGRTDLWGADHGTLIHSIKSRLFTLSDETKVFPGHGNPTRIFEEKRSNPFLI